MISTLILGFTLLSLSPVQDLSSQEKEIASVIQQQLDAFTFNDAEEAYRFTSKQIHQQFSQEQYAEKVRADYPQITKSLRVSFQKIHLDDPTHATVRAEITGFNHKKATAEYRMILEEDGWKVDGITLIPIRTSTNEATDPLQAIQSVIRRQLDAFKKDEYTDAYRFTSKSFRQQFSKERFEAMIRARFPEIARSTSTRFGKTFLYMNDTRATLEIDITGVNARTISVEYQMALEEEGWKIDRLSLLEPSRRF